MYTDVLYTVNKVFKEFKNVYTVLLLEVIIIALK